jgi:tripartite-type tricarboxylate transporter receptor subunit TctC
METGSMIGVNRRLAVPSLIGLVLAMLPLANRAEGNAPWPRRPVTIVVPYDYGSTTEIPARVLTQGLEKMFGQPFLVKNVAGAAGAIGSQQVKNARADGYTLLVTNTSAMSVLPVVRMPSPYDPVRDFSPIARLANAYMFVSVSSTIPVRNVAELITFAKQRPGELNYGTTGAGGLANFAGEYFNILAGTRIVQVPSRSGDQAMVEMIAGRTQMMMDPTILRHRSDDRVRLLAVVNKTRLPNLPDVPTVRESGGPEMQFNIWYGLFGPAGMPADISTRLHAAAEKVLSTPEAREALLNVGFVASVAQGSVLRREIESDLGLLQEIKKKAGIDLK